VKIKFVLVSDLRKEYSKNNAFDVNNMKFNIVYGTVFGFLGPNACKHHLGAKQETMGYYRATVLQARHAAELVTSAALVDIVAQDKRHEVEIKDTFD
jgi:ABC-type lipopolysaccharide export system ATPase subunit